MSGPYASLPATTTSLNKMAALGQLAARLTRSANLDELCRNAILFGCQELGFDRLGLWLSGRGSNTITGTYGMDETGKLRDEHHITLSLSADFPLVQALCRKERYAYKTDVMLTTPEGAPIAMGWQATAALWDGEEIIGYLFTDNLLSKRPYGDDEGELLALYAMILGHLYSRQQVEEALRAREAYHQALIDAIPDYLFVITEAGTILDYHAAQVPLLPPANMNVIGSSIYAVLHTQLAARYLQAIQEVLRTRQIVTLDHSLYYGERLHHFETRITAIDKDKTVALVRDVTDRKTLEEQLYAAQKMESLGRMAGGIAHDFNNLLTVIQGFATVAETQLVRDTTKVTKALAHIRSASEKGAHLTNQLLLFARKQVVQATVVNVNALIQEMTTILSTLLGDTIELRLDLAPTVGQIYIDVSQFEQVLLNVAANARDAMANGGQFTIRTRNLLLDETEGRLRFGVAAGSYVLTELSDTGVGIEETLQKQIFDPFFTTKAHSKGTGLGLAICLSIVQQSGGQLQVQSVLNQGTTFQLLLPRSWEDSPSVDPVEESAESTGAETILLVEDDEPVREVAVEILSSYGYTVLECANGFDALQKAREHSNPIHLLMTDMLMPQMSGREVAEQFMQLRPQVPVLLVSGYVDQLPEQLINRDEVTFLPKPYTLPVLTETVRSILDQHPLPA